MNHAARLLAAGRATLADSVRVSFDLFKVMVPVLVTVKILKEFDLVRPLAAPLTPLMDLVGLPAKMGLVWATALVVNIYSGLAVYVSLAQESAALSVGQATILATMILFAHSMPVELKVAQRCGVSLWGQGVIRMAAAIVCGLLLRFALAPFERFSAPAPLLFKAAPPAPDLGAWAWAEFVNLLWIFLIILALMAMMRVLQALRVVEMLNRLFAPILRLMGIGRDAATITVVGMVLGLSYGSGLIIHEARSGKVSDKDLFASLSLMGMAHALIEDTLLMALIGANILGTFWARMVFAMLATALLAKGFDMARKRRGLAA
jgi:hypothetical protein